MRKFFFLGALLAAFFIASAVQADYFPINTADSYTSYSWSDYANYQDAGLQLLGNGYTGTFNQIYAKEYMRKNTSWDPSLGLALFECSDYSCGTVLTVYNFDATSTHMLSDSTFDPYDVFYTSSSSITLNSGSYYAFRTIHTGAQWKYAGGSLSGTVYCEAAYSDNATYVSASYCSDPSRYYVFQTSGPPPPTTSIQLEYPTNGVVTPPFANWVVSIYSSDPLNEILRDTGVFWTGFDPLSNDCSSGTPSPGCYISHTNYLNLSSVTSTSGVFQIPIPPTTIPGNPLASTTLWATPFTTDASGTAAYGDTISFTLWNLAPTPSSTASTTVAAGPFGSNGESPNGTSTLVTTCDPYSNVFANSLCQLFVWLFYPPSGVLDGFSNLKTDYQNKPPFGYFTAAKNLFSNLNASSSSYGALSLPGEIGDAFNPLVTGLSWLLWFVFGWWVVHRIRKLEL